MKFDVNYKQSILGPRSHPFGSWRGLPNDTLKSCGQSAICYTISFMKSVLEPACKKYKQNSLKPQTFAPYCKNILEKAIKIVNNVIIALIK